MIIRNVIYAVLLGISMAACLSQQDETAVTNAEAEQADKEETLVSDEPEILTEPVSSTIEKGQVGNIKVGMPIEQFRNNVPAGLRITDTTLSQEGQQSTAYVLTQQNKDKGTLVEQVCQPECKVWRIRVQAPDYKTAKGLGVGSKYNELQQAYTIQSVTFEEGNLVATAPEAGMSFIMDKSQVPAQQLASISKNSLPANTLVKEVLVY